MIAHSTEDKQYWCGLGMELEVKFVENVAPYIGLNLIIHPNKKANPYSVDLLNKDTGIGADLKTQKTPFFTATKYGLDPQYTVTFNRKDYERYSKLYPDITIYWWIMWWNQLTYKEYKVTHMYGVWEVPFEYIQKEIENKRATLHGYLHRQNDNKGNAKESYLFNLNHFKRLI